MQLVLKGNVAWNRHHIRHIGRQNPQILQQKVPRGIQARAFQEARMDKKEKEVILRRKL